jgi:2-keto-4-pentenoate hydratase/2-oxohepta-3-ene-1,7-dioic acid hydratase in catechol pathway
MTILPPAIFAIGRNYADHAAEMTGASEPPPAHPMIFMKNPACVIGDGDAIVIPASCRDPEQVDYEGELAVIIGRTCRDVGENEALGVVSGYAAANDVSARWWQNSGSGGQFCKGKSFDTFCPIGSIASAAKVGDPQSLELVTRLNGEIMQKASTSTMLFSVARLIAELSSATTLLAGTVILTGTPGGVGSKRKPPRWLRTGDVVEVEISGVGRIRNPVKADGGT